MRAFVIDAGSGAITLTSALDRNDAETVTLTATATANGKTDTATVTVTVARSATSNDAPSIEAIPAVALAENDYTDHTVASVVVTDTENDATDLKFVDENDVLQDTITHGGATFSFDSNNNIKVDGTLDHEAADQIILQVRAVDSANNNESANAPVLINIGNENEAPTTFTLEISTGGDIANPRVGDTLTVTPDVIDPDGFTGEYTYTWWRKDSDGTNRVQITDGASPANPITTASYTLGTDDQGKLVEAVVGDYRDDGNFNNTPDSSGLTTAKAVQEEANAAPTITTTNLTATIPEGDYSVGQGLEFFTLEVADTDGDTLTYDLDQASKDAGFSIAKNAEGNGVISYGRHVNFEDLADGDKVVTITASVTDGKIATPLTAEITVTFTDVNEQTIFNLSGDTITPAVGDTLEITTSQDDPEGDDNVTYGYTWWRVDENDVGNANYRSC